MLPSGYRRRASAKFLAMVWLSSQWVAMSTGHWVKISSRAWESSTSKLPVEEPIKTFTPQVSPVCSCLISSILVLLAPK